MESNPKAASMSPSVLVPIADGSEEIEAVTIIDVLRRAGAHVVVASAGTLQITASRGVKLVADKLLAECIHEIFDMVVLPGGIPGAENLRDSQDLARILKQQAEGQRWLGAICAAPAVVLAPYGLLEGRKATCHPAFSDRIKDPSAMSSRVVVDGNLVTSRGPGTALEFALKLVELLFGRPKAEEVARPMIVPP
jgi:4-methyl-5(b-hydroxyethyl)-thiazole monophosphate biosynthesis